MIKIENKNLPTDVIHKEIDLIQSCISRMAQNSFLLKGWLVSIAAVVIALLPQTFYIEKLCSIIIMLILCFWYLDGFILKLEKLYRRKYEWVIIERLKGNPDYLYNLDPYNEMMWIKPIKKDITILNSMFSKTLIPFYGFIITLILYFCIKY